MARDHLDEGGARKTSTTTRIRSLGPITTRVFNPVIRRVAGRLPGFGILTHTGRTTGRRYRTPLLIHRRGDDYVFGLWYGSDVHWVKNVLAASGCEVRVRGLDLRLIEPVLFADPARRLLPLPLRIGGRLLRMTEFLRMRAAHEVPTSWHGHGVTIPSPAPCREDAGPADAAGAALSSRGPCRRRSHSREP